MSLSSSSSSSSLLLRRRRQQQQRLWILVSCLGAILFLWSSTTIIRISENNNCDENMNNKDYDNNHHDAPTTTTTTTITSSKKKMKKKRKHQQPRILVTYTGPSDRQSRNHQKKQLYERNLDYFLQYGMIHACQNRDTIITVGHEYFHEYYPRVQALDDACQQQQQQQHQTHNENNKDEEEEDDDDDPGRPHFVRLVARRNVCYDMESVRMVFQGAVGGVPPILSYYDYFIYLNCGVTGPHPFYQETWVSIVLAPLFESTRRTDEWRQQQQQRQRRKQQQQEVVVRIQNNETITSKPAADDNDEHHHHTNRTLRMLSKEWIPPEPLVRMTGLSVHCQDDISHVQSMMYALDKVGLETMFDIPFDCLTKDKRHPSEFINDYERAMGRRMTNAGHGISTFLGDVLQNQSIAVGGSGGGGGHPNNNNTDDDDDDDVYHNNTTSHYTDGVITKFNRDQCNMTDPWLTKYLHTRFHGQYPSLNQTIFWKTSRIITPEIQELIGYEGEVKWNW